MTLKNQINNKDKKSIIILSCASALMLLASGALISIWNYIGIGMKHGAITERIVMLYAVVIPLCALELSIYITKISKIDTLIKISVPLYIISMIIGITTTIVGNKNGWLRVSYAIFYAPAFLYFSVFVVAYMVSRYKTYGLFYFGITAILSVIAPCVLSLLGLNCLAISLVLIITLSILSIKLVKDKKLTKTWIYFLIGFLICFVLGTVFLIIKDGSYASRFQITFTKRSSDTYSEGWMYSNLISALKTTPLIGQSGYYVSAADGVYLPAYQYFASDSVYLVASLILKFGWIICIPITAIGFTLVASLYKISNFAKNNFSKYFAYSVGILFAVRIVINLISCFSFYLHGTYLPFAGNNGSSLIDMILFTSAVALCLKKNDVSSDLIDKDYPTTELLSFAKMEFERIYESEEEKTSTIKTEKERNEFYSTIKKLKQNIEVLSKENERLKNGEKVSQLSLSRKYAPIVASLNAFDVDKPKRDTVFISYSHNDYQLTEYLSNKLESRGIKTWFSERNIISKSYPSRIMSALKHSSVLVVLLTRTSNESEHVFNEVALGFEMLKDGMTIMPIIIDDIVLSDELEYYLCRQEQMIAVTPPVEKQLDKFADRIESVYKDIINENE